MFCKYLILILLKFNLPWKMLSYEWMTVQIVIKWKVIYFVYFGVLSFGKVVAFYLTKQFVFSSQKLIYHFLFIKCVNKTLNPKCDI